MGSGRRGEAGGVRDDEPLVGADGHLEALEALPHLRLERGRRGARRGGGKKKFTKRMPPSSLAPPMARW